LEKTQIGSWIDTLPPGARACWICGSLRFERHHIIGASGRKDIPTNIFLLCRICHEMVHSSKRKWLPRLLYLRRRYPGFDRKALQELYFMRLPDEDQWEPRRTGK